MKNTAIPKVKICCISSTAEALTAISHGASALGLVSNMPSGPGVISDEMILKIVEVIPETLDTFLLTSEIETKQIILQHKKFKTRTLQLVDEVKLNVYEELKYEIPEVKLVQVIHVIDESSIDYANSISKYVDAILLDSGNPNLKVKELGGTGKVHDWSISSKIREKVDVPVFLAGGLNPENVREAIETVEPYGVDLCSGVRTNGKLDEGKLKKFFEAVRSS
ncbi:MAG: phosphoribosylanthranilate isomerase [Ignavibacteria bacterium]|nr:phosphoribosylanthranilate isomerase [Ignavibacteria bacterium]